MGSNLSSFYDAILNVLYGHEKAANRGSLIQGGPIKSISTGTLSGPQRTMFITYRDGTVFKLTMEEQDEDEAQAIAQLEARHDR
jgi:hypothetical protein